ncbi:hypothetical protein [Pollutibacter soli]|uniref:hypothetical protein n=1 Tax=Pollutibacter soli TaxID=3034157 RepID=UPI003013E640
MSSKVELIEPVWYGGTNKSIIKKIVGKKFSDQASLLNFLTEFHELMLVGSGGKYIATSLSERVVTYNLVQINGSANTGSNSGDDVWLKIKVRTRKSRIVRYKEINRW